MRKNVKNEMFKYRYKLFFQNLSAICTPGSQATQISADPTLENNFLYSSNSQPRTL
jgi:hypothetical protein